MDTTKRHPKTVRRILLVLVLGLFMLQACDQSSGDTKGDGEDQGPRVSAFTTSEELEKIRTNDTCLVVIAHNQLITYGDPLPELSYTLEGSCVGSGGETLADLGLEGAITLSAPVTQWSGGGGIRGRAAVSSDVGEYPITVQVDELALPPSIHSVRVSHATLTIIPAFLDVRTNDIHVVKTFDDPEPVIPPVTWQVSGLKLDDTEDVIQGLQFSFDDEYWPSQHCLRADVSPPPGYEQLLVKGSTPFVDQPPQWCLPLAAEAPPKYLDLFEPWRGLGLRIGYYALTTLGPNNVQTAYNRLIVPDGIMSAGDNYIIRYTHGQLFVAIQTNPVQPLTPWDTRYAQDYPLGFPRAGLPFILFAAHRYRAASGKSPLDDTIVEAWLTHNANPDNPADGTNLDAILPFVAAYLSHNGWRTAGAGEEYLLSDGNWQPADPAVAAARLVVGQFVLEEARYVRKLALQKEKELFIQWRDVDRYRQYSTKLMVLFGPSDVPPNDLSDRAAAQTATVIVGTVAAVSALAATSTSVLATLAGVTAGTLYVGFTGVAEGVTAAAAAVSATAATAAVAGGVIGGVVLAAVTAGVKIWQVVELDQTEGRYNEAIGAVDDTVLSDLSDEELLWTLIFMRASPKKSSPNIDDYYSFLGGS